MNLSSCLTALFKIWLLVVAGEWTAKNVRMVKERVFKDSDPKHRYQLADENKLPAILHWTVERSVLWKVVIVIISSWIVTKSRRDKCCVNSRESWRECGWFRIAETVPSYSEYCSRSDP